MSPTDAVPTRSLDPGALANLRELARDVDPGLFIDILTTFRDDMGKYMAEMQRAIAAGDAVGVKRSAHAIKGASMNTGALSLGGLSAQMEDAAEVVNGPVILGLWPQLVAEAQRVQADIALELSAAP